MPSEAKTTPRRWGGGGKGVVRKPLVAAVAGAAIWARVRDPAVLADLAWGLAVKGMSWKLQFRVGCLTPGNQVESCALVRLSSTLDFAFLFAPPLFRAILMVSPLVLFSAGPSWYLFPRGAPRVGRSSQSAACVLFR